MTEAQRQIIADLIAVASDRVRHTWSGDCPDDGGPQDTASRDPGCPACQVILRAEAALAAPSLTSAGGA